MTAATATTRLPAFVLEVIEDRRALNTLVAACFVIGAAGLFPQLLDPGMPDVRSALRQEPDLQSLISLHAVVQAGFLLLGGFLADYLRSERLVAIALWGLVAASIVGTVVPAGIGLNASMFIGWASQGLCLPFAIGAIAMVYTGSARATALGAGYAVLGAATAAAPALALVFGPLGARWPAFLVCGLVALIAIWVTGRGMPDLPGAERQDRPAIAWVALFAFGVISVVSAIIQIGDEVDPVGVAIMAAGITSVALAFLVRARGQRQGASLPVQIRPLSVALWVGVIVGFAQAAPLLQLPLFFQIIQGSPPLIATIAIAPFVVALLIAGPVSGWLLARVTPRHLIAAGVVAIGLADLVVVLVLGQTTPYVAFIVPFGLIGAGFVVATTVRTAIIFASMPSKLPATAAGLNESSIGLGSRLGIVVAVVTMSRVALDSFAVESAGMPPDQAASMTQTLRELLTAVGMPGFHHLIAGLDQSAFHLYAEASISGLRASLAISGIVAVIGGAIAYVAMGPRDPVRSVWEMSDERASGESSR